MKLISKNTAGVLTLACAASIADARSAGASTSAVAAAPMTFVPRETSQSLEALLALRGGAKRKSKSKSRSASLASLGSKKASSAKGKKTATGKRKVTGSKKDDDSKKKESSSLDFLQKMQPITKGYVIMVGIVTVVGIALGEEMAQSVMALDPMRIIYGMEVWRIVTAASFLGKPSISWLLSGYYLYEHGSNLERLYGPAQFLVFLLTQVSLLTVLSMMFGMPFFASSMVTSMLHVLSRITPKMEVNWLIFKIHYYLLPLALMATDVLQAGNLSAGLPHVLGMLSGHFYFFHKTIWPKTGGEDWLNAPDFMVQRLDPDASKKAGKESVNKALKSRQKRKGKALGK